MAHAHTLPRLLLRALPANGAAFLVLLAAVPAIAQSPRPAKIPVLIIDGVNNHDWQRATAGLREILETTGRFTVEVSTTPQANASKESWDGWRPQFSRYDVVVNNFNGGHRENSLRWPREVEQAFEDYVRGGGGAVIFHAANNAFLYWETYNQMIGLGWRDPDFGPGLIIGSDEKPVLVPRGEGLKPGHGPRHDFEMTVMPAAHPITRGMPRRWLHPSEQLTHGQHGPAADLKVITYAFSRDSKQNEPMDWVRTYGKGRVYTTMLGHTWKDQPNPNLECVGFQTLFARGVEWAASGKVSIPVPKEFPAPDRVVLYKLKSERE